MGPQSHLSKTMCRSLWLMLVLSVGLGSAQEESACYGPGSITLSVVLSVLFTALLLAAFYYLWKKYRKRKELILETDPEKGKGEYAFDNPGFKDPGLTPITKTLEKNNKLEAGKAKWNQWSPLAALSTIKPDKRKTLDDSAIDGNEVKVVALRSHDFTGLGFNICGNMKEGIYIKDVLHRGPASESRKLNSGDRINSVTISFEHMVYEDALTILSYASPYEVIIEARGGKLIHHASGQGAQPSHPVYRSSSCTDLYPVDSSTKRRLFGEDHTGSLSSNYSSLQKSRSNMTTLERRESESPKIKQPRSKKAPPKLQLSPEQLKAQLEQKMADHQHNLLNKDVSPRIEMETQRTENKHQKFGIRVLPPETSPKSAEQNDNNINIEKQPLSIDEVDEIKPQAKRRERKPDVLERGDEFSRNNLNGSGIRRDANGIPQEIPAYMLNAAVAARSNRKTSEDKARFKEEDNTPKKKGKAPAPPEEKGNLSSLKNHFDEIHSINDEVEVRAQSPKDMVEEIEVELRHKNQIKDYNSDSDLETDNQSSVNTIELNSSDITIHHAEENEEKQNRKTASTGDLTKIQKTRKSSTGTLERAQSLDITDSSIPTLKRKGGRIEDMDSDEDISRKVMMSKEPRLSLILDGLNTFQRNRLKKCTEWGNLEDAILKLNQEDESAASAQRKVPVEDVKFDFGEKTEELDALVNKIKEIKRESIELSEKNVSEKKKNQIWPTFEDNTPKTNGSVHPVMERTPVNEEDSRLAAVEKRQRKPPMLAPPVEEPISKPAIPEKKEFLLCPPKKIAPPVPERESTQSEEPTPSVSNKSDETKMTNPVEDAIYLNLIDLTRNFIFTEKINSSHDEDVLRYGLKADDTNISDDIKVSRHSLESLVKPKSDDAKMNVSNITVENFNETETDPDSISMEVNVNELSSLKSEDMSELYTTALDNTVKPELDSTRITITTPDIIKNATIAEAINTLNNDITIQGPSSITLEPEVKSHTFSVDLKSKKDEEEESDSSLNKSNSSLTYITEIQVLTPNSNNNTKTNVSEIEIIPNINGRNLDHEFEDYVRNFESNVKNFESNIHKFETSFDSSSKPIIITDTLEAEREMNKIQEIAEEQLKKLPEMRFTTSSYESPKTADKRQSQIELLRSNFEKSPPKGAKTETTPTKSRIPISTTMKTPPMSPERRDSKNLDMENDKALLELMSSSVHSTPMVSKLKAPSKNVTVTSIRTNSKIPSGLPVLGGASRPPIPPRRQDDEVVVSSNGGVESSFKQWVFNPSDHAVTNIMVSETKQHK